MVRLTVDGQQYDQPVEVREDPRMTVPADIRAAWTATLLEIGQVYARATDLVRQWQPHVARLRPGAPNAFTGARLQDATLLTQQLNEAYGRLGGLYNEVDNWTGPMTQDQRTQLEYLTAKLAEFSQAIGRLSG
jgi:hypothetical protein